MDVSGCGELGVELLRIQGRGSGKWKVEKVTLCTHQPYLPGSPLSALPGPWRYKTCPNWIHDPQCFPHRKFPEASF